MNQEKHCKDGDKTLLPESGGMGNLIHMLDFKWEWW